MNILVFDSTNIPTIDLASKRNLDLAGHLFDDLNELDDLTNLDDFNKLDDLFNAHIDKLREWECYYGN